jgi:hypothetical protein
MKILVKLYPLLIILVFIASCLISSKLSVTTVIELFTYPLSEHSLDIYDARVLVIQSDDIEEVFLYKLDEYKQTHSDYSFLIPKDKIEFFTAKIDENVTKKNWESRARLKVEQIEENKQLIEYTMDRDRRSYITKYEAADIEVFPISITVFDIKSAFLLLPIGIFSGIICCCIFKYFFKRYIKTNADIT